MLVLTRKVGQKITIGDDVEVVLVEVEKGQARIGISAPRRIAVHRQEVYERIAEENRLAAMSKGDAAVLVGLRDMSPRPIGHAHRDEFGRPSEPQAHYVRVK